jgi:hypothetical protein
MEYQEDEFLNKRYSILSPRTTRRIKTYATVPTPYFPNPEKQDYTRGLIIRAFAKRISDANSGIIEIDEGQLFTLKQNIFYKTTVIEWKITGVKYNITEAGNVEVGGAYEHNDTQRITADNIIPGMIDKLSDPLQFYRLT